MLLKTYVQKSTVSYSCMSGKIRTGKSRSHVSTYLSQKVWMTMYFRQICLGTKGRLVPHPSKTNKQTSVLNLQAGTLQTLQNSSQSTYSLFDSFHIVYFAFPFSWQFFSHSLSCIHSIFYFLWLPFQFFSPYLRTVEHCLLCMRSRRLVGFTTHFCFLTSGRCLPDAHNQPAPEFQDLSCSDSIFVLSKSLIK